MAASHKRTDATEPVHTPREAVEAVAVLLSRDGSERWGLGVARPCHITPTPPFGAAPAQRARAASGGVR